MPPVVLKTLMAETGFKLTVASAHMEAGNKEEAEKIASQASAQLKSNASALNLDERLQLAGLLLTLDRTAESEALFRNASVQAPGNPAVWEGLLGAQMKAGHEQAAYTALIALPASVYQEGLKRSGFLRAAAVLQAKYGTPATAEDLLRKVLALPMPPKDREGALLMLASAAMTRGDARQAADVASQLVESNPQNTDGWLLLVAAKQQQKLSAEAGEVLKRIPPCRPGEIGRRSRFHRPDGRGTRRQRRNRSSVAQREVGHRTLGRPAQSTARRAATPTRLAAAQQRRRRKGVVRDADGAPHAPRCNSGTDSRLPGDLECLDSPPR